MRGVLSSAPFALALIAATALFSGCALKQIELRRDSSLAGASLQVDVIGLNSSNKNLEFYPVSKYWLPNDPMRQGANPQRFTFGEEWETESQVAAVPKGAKSIMIVADLPGIYPEIPDKADPRRKIILKKSKLFKSKITLQIDRTGVHLEAP